MIKSYNHKHLIILINNQTQNTLVQNNEIEKLKYAKIKKLPILYSVQYHASFD